MAAAVWIRQMCSTPCCTSPMLRWGIPSKISKEQITAADVDENNRVDSTDVYYLMYYIALHGIGIDVSWDDVLAK